MEFNQFEEQNLIDPTVDKEAGDTCGLAKQTKRGKDSIWMDKWMRENKEGLKREHLKNALWNGSKREI